MLKNNLKPHTKIIPINCDTCFVAAAFILKHTNSNTNTRAGQFDNRIDSFAKSIRKTESKLLNFDSLPLKMPSSAWPSMSYSNHICSLSVMWHFVFQFYIPPTNNSPSAIKTKVGSREFRFTAPGIWA
jgi:hypothetical protein